MPKFAGKPATPVAAMALLGAPLRVLDSPVQGAQPLKSMARGVSTKLLDSDAVTGLIHHNFNSTVPGRYIFQFHNGAPLGTP
jgi:alpha-D-ribose 1-methylphosphonate 5-triphosphate synthase subunit PhnH